MQKAAKSLQKNCFSDAGIAAENLQKSVTNLQNKLQKRRRICCKKSSTVIFPFLIFCLSAEYSVSRNLKIEALRIFESLTASYS